MERHRFFLPIALTGGFIYNHNHRNEKETDGHLERKIDLEGQSRWTTVYLGLQNIYENHTSSGSKQSHSTSIQYLEYEESI